MVNNNIQTEVVWTMNDEGISELRFNYYDALGNIIGDMDVTARGDIKWQIINLEYMPYFSEIISFINGEDMSGKVVYHSKEPNGLRWTRARIYIAKKGLVINYNVEVNYSNEYERGLVR